jgi:hypothetical protein
MSTRMSSKPSIARDRENARTTNSFGFEIGTGKPDGCYLSPKSRGHHLCDNSGPYQQADLVMPHVTTSSTLRYQVSATARVYA